MDAVDAPPAAPPPPPPPTTTTDATAMPLAAMSPEAQLRHYLFTRGRVSSDLLLTGLSPLLPAPSSFADDGGAAHAGVAAALAGAAKAFVVQLAEAAAALAADGGHAGPLRESHVLDAWRRLQAAGALAGMPPRTGYCGGGGGVGERDAGSDGGGGGGSGGGSGQR